MGKSIIVTEKPSVARTFAAVLGVKGSGDGYIENDKYIITWCVGHLVTMSLPGTYGDEWKKWSLEALPFIPARFLYEIIPDVKKQFNVIKKIYNRKDVDTIYYAGDPAREGVYIQMLVRQEAGLSSGITEKVVWIDSQTEEEIKRGIKEAKPLSNYKNISEAGYARAIEDYLIGMNYSRALSKKYGEKISVGRVMTCVLGMIVKREREIRNFKVTDFYKISALGESNHPFKAKWSVTKESAFYNSPLLYNSEGFLNQKDAEDFKNNLSDDLTLIKKEIKESKKAAPFLFNLAELQGECTKRYKYSPDKTLQIAQSLYEKKLTTYPRTDARVLSTAISKVIETNISGLKKYNSEIKDVCDEILSSESHKKIGSSKYTDDSKISDHYAIIPTGEALSSIGSLSADEQKVFDLIVKRFLSIFMDPAVYSKISCEFLAEYTSENGDKSKERFSAGASKLVSPGFLALMGKTGDDDDDDSSAYNILDALKEKATYNTSYDIEKGETQPPKRYTTGSMVLAMENAGNLIEDEELRAQIKGSGIGTSATRAEIIKKLEKREYTQVNKKTQIITPTELGEKIYDIVLKVIPAMLSPEMTAAWERGLAQVESGQCTKEFFLDKLYTDIRKTIKEVKEMNGGKNFASDNDFEPEILENITCPNCGGQLKSAKKGGFYCENFKKEGIDCNMYLGVLAGHKMTKHDVTRLLTDNETDMISDFVSKSGKKFAAKLILVQEDGKYVCKFGGFEENSKKESIDGIVCPVCSGKIMKGSRGYSCENYKNGQDNECSFSIYGEVAGHNLSDSEIKDLINKKETGIITDFKSKKGSSFSAKLKLKNENGIYKTEFDFPKSDDAIDTSYKCPNCGKSLQKKGWNYECPDGDFTMQTGIAKHTFTEKEVHALLKNKKTGTIKGFAKSNGSGTFDAMVSRDENGKLSFEFPPRKK